MPAACRHVRAFALLCAAIFGRLYSAVGVAVGFLTINYFVAIVAEWWPSLQFLRKATLFYLIYYSNLWQGWPMGNMAKLAAILVATVAVGGIIWHRRDLPCSLGQGTPQLSPRVPDRSSRVS